MVLRRELTGLRNGATITLIEFGNDSVTAWQVQRDGSGTPRARHWPPMPAYSADDPQARYEEQLRPLADGGSRLLLVLSAPYPPSGELFGVVTSAHPDAPLLACRSPLAEVLRELITGIPLTHWYELVVLRRLRSGRLVFDSWQLFPAEADHRYPPQRFRIWCEPSDEHGTVFAVVAQLGGDYSMVSVQSAMLDPGFHEPTAKLLRPGQVAFEGLPVKLRTEHRSWPSLVGAVPATLDRPAPAHLICAIEVSGTKDQLRRRIDRVQQLITRAETTEGQLRVSLISYGAHSFSRKVPDEPPAALTWAGSAKTALAELAKLQKRGTPDGEYPRAAQLECALAEVIRRLDRDDGRPCLVTAGSRPPYPPRVDPRTEIIPCPRRNDWRGALQRLGGIPDMAFGTICDHDAAGPAWTQLGRDASESGDLVDVRRLAMNLGLSRPLMNVPFPLIGLDGG